MLAHPGAVVLTITAGRPGRHVLTDWDARCAFSEGDDVVGVRRLEDEAAMKVLGTRAAWLEFLDHQYAPPSSATQLAAAIEDAVAPFDQIASPLGIGHDDHVLVATACLEVARRQPKKRWILYEDVIYRRTVGGTDQAIENLRAQGFGVETAAFQVDVDVKRAAIASYTTQVRGLGELLEDAYQPERYRRIRV